MQYLFTLLISFAMIATALAQHTYKQHMMIMGCQFDITVIAEDQEQADYFIDTAVNEMRRIERLISSWDPKSQTSAINRNAGIRPVSVDQELFNLIRRALALSMVTDGAFDISYGSMDRIWKFDGSLTEMPEAQQIAQSVALVGYEKVHIQAQDTSVYLEKAGMKIGFGAIGKGYAADKAKALLQSMGCKG
ncbi:MAG: FAD:protein FMN transferase, partial [Bacteroidia bacterium]|nr:FAD:protein FMN transferase [Bacteroidia bacterium]